MKNSNQVIQFKNSSSGNPLICNKALKYRGSKVTSNIVGSISLMLFICICVVFPGFLKAEDKFWTGNISNDWNVAGNWSPAGVPTSADDVGIVFSTDNDPVIFSGTNATIRSIYIVENNFTINNGGSLTINNTSNFISLELHSSVFTNNGTLNLNSTISVQPGILLNGVSSVTNSGVMNFITNFVALMFPFGSSILTNGGSINILGGSGILNNENVSANINNLGIINSVVDGHLLLLNIGATFTNSGTLSSSGNYFVLNSGATIINQNCGRIICSGSNPGSYENNAGTTTNSGLIQINGGLVGGGSFTNSSTGVLKYGNISSTITNSNGSVIVNNNPSNTSIFSYTGTFTGTINGIFTNPAGTTSAGTFTAPNTFTPSGLPAGSQTLYARITPSGGACFYVVPFTYVMGSAPVFNTNPSSQTVCSGTNTSFTVAASDASSYQWQANTGAGFSNLSNGGSYSNVTSTTLNINPALSSMNGYQYRCIATGPGGSAISNFATLTVTAPPSTANAGPDQTGAATCGLTQVTLAANTPSIGTGAWSILSGTGGSFGNASSASSTFSGLAGNTYTLRWTITNSPCNASTDDVVVTFNRNPTSANAGPDQTGASTCGLTQVTLAANTPSIGTGAWSIVSGTGGSFGNASSASSTFSGTAGNTYTLRWTVSNSPCTASTDDVVIAFNATPTVTCPSSISVEDNDPPFALTGASPAGGTYSGTGVSSNTFNPASAGLGPHSILYTYSSPQGCTNSCSFTVTVTASCTVYSWYLDADNDGYYTGSAIIQCDSPGPGYKNTGLLGGGDCNDNNAEINPAATEVCDGIDNNCNGMIDEGVQTTYYRDMDGDGFGDPLNTILACSVPAGYVSNNTDCNDNNALERPGQVWYKDTDNDGYAQTGAATITQCLRPEGYKASSELISTTGDCDDNNAAVNPGATEICDGIDNNCNAQIDEGVLITYYADNDGDGFGDPTNTTQACTLPGGYVTNNTDCDDTNADINPLTIWYLDADNDGYYTGTGITQCESPGQGYKYTGLNGGGDCNDSNPDINPGATEICNGIDDNCSGGIDEEDVCCPLGGIFYVDVNAQGSNDGSSWANAFTDLQSALTSSCGAPLEIWVAAGTYYPDQGPGQINNSRGSRFQLKNGMKLYGGFSGTETMLSQRNWSVNVTTLSGDINQSGTLSGNAYTVVYGIALTNEIVLDGFSIVYGNASTGVDGPTSDGGGIFFRNVIYNISNCTFENNFANFAGGGANIGQSSGTIFNCIFQNNYGNNGGGIYIRTSPYVNIQNCIFKGNSGDTGAGLEVDAGTVAQVLNSEFSQNEGGLNSGISVLGSTLSAVNCTFSGQWNTSNQGVFYTHFGAVLAIQNCILWNNRWGASISNPFNILGGSTITVSHSLIQNSGGSGNWQFANITDLGSNIDANPFFVQDVDFNLFPNSNSNLRLLSCSPAINAGNNSFNVQSFDLDGNQRVFGAAIDMGAYELQSASTIPLTCYSDADMDGYGNPAVSQQFCDACGDGYVTDNTDCDDTNTDINPATIWYLDADNDGYYTGTGITQCESPGVGYKYTGLIAGGDCDDSNPDIHPGAEEICNDLDDDCNGIIDDLGGSTKGNWVNDDIGNANGSAVFPPCEAEPIDTFHIQTSGFGQPNSDTRHIVYQILCGDMSISARVLDVKGGGWAGISLQESLLPGSKKAALKTQLSNLIMREIRLITGANQNLLILTRPQHKWLKLERLGNTFNGYTSNNGINWSFAFTASIPMNECIHIGLFAESTNNSNQTSVQIDQVNISGGQNQNRPPVNQSDIEGYYSPASFEVDVYPNPVNGYLHLRLNHREYISANIQVLGLLGEMLIENRVDDIRAADTGIDVSNLPTGIYLLRVISSENEMITKRIIKQ